MGYLFLFYGSGPQTFANSSAAATMISFVCVEIPAPYYQYTIQIGGWLLCLWVGIYLELENSLVVTLPISFGFILYCQERQSKGNHAENIATQRKCPWTPKFWNWTIPSSDYGAKGRRTGTRRSSFGCWFEGGRFRSNGLFGQARL